MVARGAGAAGPVLLACRQWDPLGLARRLPSLGVGAWRCAPLLPWRVQCPVCVCAALAAGSGGFAASLGTICAASRCAGAGPLVLRGPHLSRRLGRGGGSHSGSPLGRGGSIPPASGGGGRGPRGWRAGGGAGGGGGVAPRPPCSRSGRRPAVLLSGSLRVAGALPSGARVRSGLKCRPGVGGG